MRWIVNKLNMMNIDKPHEISSCVYSMGAVQMAIIGKHMISLLFIPTHIDGSMFIKVVNL